MAESPNRADAPRDNPEEQYTKKQFGLLLYRLKQLPAISRAKVQSTLAETLLNETGTIETPAGPLSFALLGKVSAGRVLSLLTKQPATIKWIDAFRPGSILWDVGANVGVFTMYAALRGHRVVAFEPAAVNYFLLSANCEANKLTHTVDCLLAGLGAKRAVAHFEVSQFSPAASFSVEKSASNDSARQSAFVVSMDELVEDYGLPCPHYVKIDAPGMSEAIVAGGARMLRRPELREVHIELREDSRGGPRVIELLERAGLSIAGRHEHGGGTADMTFARAR